MKTIFGLVLIAVLLAGTSAATYADERSDRGDRARAQRACSQTSQLMRAACSAEVRDDFLVQKAKCLNESERAERRECWIEARETLVEEGSLCRDQLEARLNVCEAIGEAPYDPRFEAEDFETSLANLTTPNPYFPMGVGYQWIYGGDEDIQVDVRSKTKLIDDITCFVVQDVVTVDGRLVEDTDDWFAVKRADGSIWYCGEEVKDYEYFEGDSPSLPELVAIDGSFKVERDGDRAGIVFPGYPEVGHVYRQEFSLGNAEDIGEVVSTTYSWGVDPELDELVPQDLAEFLCQNDCVVVAEYTPIEPDAFERKYFAPGIGFFLATNPDDEESVQLTSCNFDMRCGMLPQPE